MTGGSYIDRLAAEYQARVSLPWDDQLAGSERVWIAVYPPDQERRLRAHLELFRLVTERNGYHWRMVDIASAFGGWLASQEYAESYFAEPDALGPAALNVFLEYLAEHVRASLSLPGADATTVTAITGAGALFGVARVSDLLERVSTAIRGRLLVFFPGVFDQGTYRLLDARDGWNYRAVLIRVSEGA